jgi:Fe2+ transport system protein FeoA
MRITWQFPRKPWHRVGGSSDKALRCKHGQGACRCGRRLLTDCIEGQSLTVLTIDQDLSCAQRLRELGILEGTHIMLMRRTDPILVLAKDSRIAIDVHAARRVEVQIDENQ